MGCTRKIDLSHHAYLSDSLWDRIAPHIPQATPNPRGGQPPHSARACLEGILYVLVTGCQWEKLPKCFPSSSTCWRRFDEWARTGVFESIWLILLLKLEHLGRIDWREVLADAWFARAKKGGMEWETPNAAKAAKWSTSSTPAARRWPFTPPPPMKAK